MECIFYYVFVCCRVLQGLWRIPSSDIDRAGSFATHMVKAINLTFKVLVSVDDHRTLYNLHLQLRRSPELEK